jgi:hypothetical protein
LAKERAGKKKELSHKTVFSVSQTKRDASIKQYNKERQTIDTLKKSVAPRVRISSGGDGILD